jgi:hypothetical protein
LCVLTGKIALAYSVVIITEKQKKQHEQKLETILVNYTQNHTVITIKDNSLCVQSSVGTHSWQEFPDYEQIRMWITLVLNVKVKTFRVQFEIHN